MKLGVVIVHSIHARHLYTPGRAFAHKPLEARTSQARLDVCDDDFGIESHEAAGRKQRASHPCVFDHLLACRCLHKVDAVHIGTRLDNLGFHASMPTVTLLDCTIAPPHHLGSAMLACCMMTSG